ncbi:MAG TPA: LptA/OstA family protein, partial [bacterium]|nr:LptA/OstA family protein [bacterium]
DARVTAERLDYDGDSEELSADGNARLEYFDLVMTSESMKVDYIDDRGVGTGSVKLDDPDYLIESDGFEIDMKSATVTFTGNVELTEKAEDGGTPFRLSSGKIVYEWKKKKGFAEGAVKVKASERTAESERLEFDRDKKQYTFRGTVFIKQESGEWLADRPRFRDNESRAKNLATRPTEIYCEDAFIDDDAGLVELKGDPARVVQERRELKARAISVDEKSKVFDAGGDVIFSQESGDWLFENGLVEDDLQPEAEERLRRAFSVCADSLRSLYGESKVYAEGNVRLEQGGNKGRADRAWYYGEEGKTVLEGAVRFLDDTGREISAGTIVYHSDDDVVEAFQAIKGSSLIPENPQQNP